MLCESWWSREEHKPAWPAQHPIATGLRIALGLLLPTHPQALLHPSMSARDTGSHAALQLVYGEATTFHSVRCCCLGVQGLTGVQEEESRGSLHTASRSALMKKSQVPLALGIRELGGCVLTLLQNRRYHQLLPHAPPVYTQHPPGGSHGLRGMGPIHYDLAGKAREQSTQPHSLGPTGGQVDSGILLLQPLHPDCCLSSWTLDTVL